MLVVRGTQKLRNRVKKPLAEENDASSTLLGDWFATALFWKPQVALLVNARTYLPLFVPLAPAGGLLQRLPDEIARYLAIHGVDPKVVDVEREAMDEVRIAPTNDRSVVGVMTEFAFLGEHFFDGDLTMLSLRLADTPVGPLRTNHHYPNAALADALDTGSSAAPAPESAPEAAPEPASGPATEPATEATAKILAFPISRMLGLDVPPIGPSSGQAPTPRPPRSTTASSAAPGAVFQLKVTLLNTKPPIWRRIVVDGTTTLDRLHEIIQAAFGWWNCHLHDFEVGRTTFGVPDPDFDANFDFGPRTIDERTVQLDAIANEGTSFHYTYDFGDDWRHKVTVEKVTPADADTVLPECIGGKRACPPEDCGGPWGYQDLLERGRLDFDPALFDLDDFTFNLANIRSTAFDF